MAVIGIGIDVVEVARLGAALSRTPALARRLFTDAERVLALPRLAGRLAAKEALAKALGAPTGLQWADAEVIVDAGGRPVLLIEGTVAAAAERLGVRRWHVSLSHDGGLAVAVVVAES